MEKQTKVIIGVIGALILLILASFIATQQTGLGHFSSLSACEAKADKLLDGDFYVVCTECGTEFSQINGYYSGACFGSGSTGNKCISAGGTCKDVNCKVCEDKERSCEEDSNRISSTTRSKIYELDNWGDVCDRVAYRITCNNPYKLDGREYASRISSLGNCLTPETQEEPEEDEEPTCTPSYTDTCDMTDGCGGTRDTEAHSCGNNLWCSNGDCSDPCTDSVEAYCDGTTKMVNTYSSEADGSEALCIFDAEINSLECGYVPPEDEVPEEDLPDQEEDLPDAGDEGTNDSTDTFLEQYAWYIVGGIVILVMLLIIWIATSGKKKRKG